MKKGGDGKYQMSISLNPPRPILIVDDEASILLAVDTTLQIAGLNNTITCQDSRQVMDLMADTDRSAVAGPEHAQH
jgi:DNA-binding NtrC family response regulator